MPALRYRISGLISSVTVFAVCTILLRSSFDKVSLDAVTSIYFYPLSLICLAYGLSIVSACFTGVTVVGLAAAILSSFMSILATVRTGSAFFLLFILYYLGLFLFLYFEQRKNKNNILMNDLEIERLVEEKNILEKEFSDKTQALESFLHKYADYANLRRVIDDFSSTLLMDKICDLIIKNVFDIIGKGELALLYLSDMEESSLSLKSSKSRDKKRRTKIKKGDIFDQWVLKNKQRLVVSDTTKDVRFDKELAASSGDVKSLIITPLVYSSRIVGTLRVNSEISGTFSTDDLRVLSIIGGIASSALSNAYLYQKTEELAIKDSLTGVYVHRYFKQRLKEEYKRALLTNTPLTMIMADLDNFKTYNDRYGHSAGDIVLKTVSTILKRVVGDNGFVARYGGEEFAVILPKTLKEEGCEIAERIRSEVEAAQPELRGITTTITMSIGVANLPQDTLDSQELIKFADNSLYEAKGSGKNRVVAFSKG